MKENYTEEIEKAINERKRLPKELEEKMNSQVFRNLIFAGCIMLYFIMINLGFFNIQKEIFVNDTIIFSIASLAVTIILFEKAFKTEEGKYALNGMEVLTASLFTYFIPYTYFYTSEKARKVLMLIPLAYVIYYTGKGIAICIKTHAMRQSDAKEITKKESIKQDDIINIDKDKEAEEHVHEKVQRIREIAEEEQSTHKISLRKKIRPIKSDLSEKEKNDKTPVKKTTTRKKKTELEEKIQDMNENIQLEPELKTKKKSETTKSKIKTKTSSDLAKTKSKLVSDTTKTRAKVANKMTKTKTKTESESTNTKNKISSKTAKTKTTSETEKPKAKTKTYAKTNDETAKPVRTRRTKTAAKKEE